MYLVLIAWFYVVMMAAISEASSPNGTLLGAVITFVFYGLIPMTIVAYIMGTSRRRKAREKRIEGLNTGIQNNDKSVTFPNAGGESPSHTIPTVRKEP
jgi:hypothetical protein